MTLDKSLRQASRLVRSRNVLKRGERIHQLKLEERWQEEQSPYGLPKVRVALSSSGKKKKKKKKEEEEEEEGEESTDSTET